MVAATATVIVLLLQKFLWPAASLQQLWQHWPIVQLAFFTVASFSCACSFVVLRICCYFGLKVVRVKVFWLAATAAYSRASARAIVGPAVAVLDFTSLHFISPGRHSLQMMAHVLFSSRDMLGAGVGPGLQHTQRRRRWRRLKGAIESCNTKI